MFILDETVQTAAKWWEVRQTFDTSGQAGAVMP